MTDRKTIYEEVSTFDPDGCTPQEVIDKINNIIKHYGNNVTIDRETHHYDEGYYFAVKKPRPETDVEYKNRRASEEQWKTRQMEIRRAEYEKMKKEFEKS